MIDYLKSLIGVIIFSCRRWACTLAWTSIKIKQYPMVRRLGRCGFTSNELCQPAKGDYYAILATMGNNYIEDGFFDLLGILRDFDINPIIVINRKIDEESFKKLSSRAHRIITRPNFGRDMGAFKEASLYLYDQKISPARLLYFNDSLIYLDSDGLREMVKSLLVSSSDVLGATQSFERYYHIGSFIFSLSRKAFEHPQTKTFWENYRQYNLRPHSILKGELGFSRWMQKQGFLLDAIYQPERLMHEVNSLTQEELLKRFIYVRPSYRSALTCLLATFSNFTCPPEIIRQSAVALLLSGGTHSQVHNYFGLFYNILRLPIIKKDIIYRGIFTEPELSLILNDLPQERKHEIFKILNNRGIESEKTGLKTFFSRALMLE